jgi:hypothetical protein
LSEQAFFWILGLLLLAITGLAGACWKHFLSDAEHREKQAERDGRAAIEREMMKARLEQLSDRYHKLREEKITEAFEAGKRYRRDE